MTYQTIIRTDELLDLIHKNEVLVIDCRYNLFEPGEGNTLYRESHIPGAIFAHLDRDLSGVITENTGRHPLPNLNHFKAWLINNGVSRNEQIVIYDDSSGGIAARLWWMLRQIEYPNVAVLEGGYSNWKAMNLPTTAKIEERPKLKEDIEVPYDWSLGTFRIFDAANVMRVINDDNIEIVDSRAAERFSGENEIIDPVAGHIPSAVNLFWQDHLNEDGNLIPKDSLLTNLENLDKQVVYYCGSGVTACFNVLVSEFLNLSPPIIYIGSWSDWIKKYPTEIGLDS
ncbi:MAG: sulfurtransferase [Candidatus Kariarchaeaceae archaeon]